MPPRDDPNRPEWTGKRKVKNFARINKNYKGCKLSDGLPYSMCPKCKMEHKFKECPVCGCSR